MESVRYDITKEGVMVQLLTHRPTAAEWTDMMHYMITHAVEIRCVLVLNRGNDGPNATQRSQLKETLRHLRPKLPVAVLTDSKLARAAMTAILWLTGKQEETGVFASGELGKAFEFLGLDKPARTGAQSLIARLSD